MFVSVTWLGAKENGKTQKVTDSTGFVDSEDEGTTTKPRPETTAQTSRKEKYPKELKIQRILVVSRVLFPLSFAAFNVVYWYIYFPQL